MSLVPSWQLGHHGRLRESQTNLLATSCDFNFTLTCYTHSPHTICHIYSPHTILSHPFPSHTPVTLIPLTQSLPHPFPSHTSVTLPSYNPVSHPFPSHNPCHTHFPHIPFCHTRSPHIIPVTLISLTHPPVTLVPLTQSLSHFLFGHFSSHSLPSQALPSCFLPGHFLLLPAIPHNLAHLLSPSATFCHTWT